MLDSRNYVSQKSDRSKKSDSFNVENLNLEIN